ncbi:hypothetical protein ATHSA_0713 [Athalassotoga saccharophila]|nr:hypothetical protein ATHSA_0713 [Athalassotoga saccharophila]
MFLKKCEENLRTFLLGDERDHFEIVEKAHLFMLARLLLIKIGKKIRWR